MSEGPVSLVLVRKLSKSLSGRNLDDCGPGPTSVAEKEGGGEGDGGGGGDDDEDEAGNMLDWIEKTLAVLETAGGAPDSDLDAGGAHGGVGEGGSGGSSEESDLSCSDDDGGRSTSFDASALAVAVSPLKIKGLDSQLASPPPPRSGGES